MHKSIKANNHWNINWFFYPFNNSVQMVRSLHKRILHSTIYTVQIIRSNGPILLTKKTPLVLQTNVVKRELAQMVVIL